MKAIRTIILTTPRRYITLSINRRALLSSSLIPPPRPTNDRGRAFNSSLAIEYTTNHHESSIFNGSHTTNNINPPIFAPQEATTPLRRFHKLVETGVLRGDDHQTLIIHKLQNLHNQLINYDPPVIPHPSASNSLLSRIFSLDTTTPYIPPENVPKGLYLFGDVGTGKTMLMDLFYHTLPPSLKRKRRVHFHAFMIDVHKRVHAAKIAMGINGGDPILPVARDLANEASVLCFDEFQVTDIADAMILRRLLESLTNFGVVCVMTSNRHPDDLYKNGIQRSSFIPAIELLKSHFDVTSIDSRTDYRRIPRALSHVYYHPLTPSNVLEVSKIFEALTSSDPSDPPIRNRELHTWGRTLVVPESSSKVAKFTFEDLCGKALSAADYLEVTKTFGTVFVLDVPKMGLHSKDMARRFITFIDACYESKTKLFVTSEVPVFQVFSDDAPNSAESSGERNRKSPNRCVYTAGL